MRDGRERDGRILKGGRSGWMREGRGIGNREEHCLVLSSGYAHNS